MNTFDIGILGNKDLSSDELYEIIHSLPDITSGTLKVYDDSNLGFSDFSYNGSTPKAKILESLLNDHEHENICSLTFNIVSSKKRRATYELNIFPKDGMKASKFFSNWHESLIESQLNGEVEDLYVLSTIRKSYQHKRGANKNVFEFTENLVNTINSDLTVAVHSSLGSLDKKEILSQSDFKNNIPRYIENYCK